jgi:hypothetical protein
MNFSDVAAPTFLGHQDHRENYDASSSPLPKAYFGHHLIILNPNEQQDHSLSGTPNSIITNIITMGITILPTVTEKASLHNVTPQLFISRNDVFSQMEKCTTWAK